MFNLKFASILVFMSRIFSCQPAVTFTEPQPLGVENLDGFPKNSTGSYLSLEDSSLLSVSNKMITRKYDLKFSIHKNQLDSNYLIGENTISNTLTNESAPYYKNGDSLVVWFRHTDTLFTMDYDNVVRKFKGYYFLNKRHDKNAWEVLKMELKNGTIVFSSISSEEEIKNLKNLPESVTDSLLPTNFSVTKKQFKDFVLQNGFIEQEVFVRNK